MKNRLKEFRSQSHLTLAELAIRSKVPVSTISDMEHGRVPLLDSAMLVAKALESSIEDLWSLD